MTAILDDPLTAPGADPSAAMSQAASSLRQLTQAEWWRSSPAELLEQALVMEDVMRTAQAARLSLLAEVDARGAALDAGARSTAAWLTAKARVPYGEAKRTARLASGLRDHAPRVAEGLAEGGITPAHAEVIADVLRHLATQTLDGIGVFTAVDLGTAEETLLELAATLDPTSLRRAGQHLVTVMTAEHADPAVGEEPVVPAEFSISRLSGFGGGGTFRGSADHEGLAVIEAALSALSAPRPATAEGPDTRTAAQRRGEALVEILRRHLATGDLGDEGGTGVALVVTTTLETLSSGVGAGTLDDGTAIPAQHVRRLACDAHVIPALLGSASQPLDIGRATRVVPAGMRRALILRDQHCAFPGCETPARWCDAHHITHWSKLGRTALDNLVLLCGRHHRLVHHSDWDVTMGADGYAVFHPPRWLHPDITMADPTWRTRINTDYGGPPNTS